MSTSTRARPRAWFAAFVARQHVRARAHDRLRAPRAAPRRGASLRQKVRGDRDIGGPIRFSDACAFYVPEATRDASTSARSAHDVIAPAESRDARATRVFVAARTPPLSRSAPAARRASGRITRRRGPTRSRCSLAPVVPLRPGKGSFLSVFLFTPSSRRERTATADPADRSRVVLVSLNRSSRPYRTCADRTRRARRPAFPPRTRPRPWRR